jgi:hypothetical protein
LAVSSSQSEWAINGAQERSAGCKASPQCSGPVGVCNEAGFKKTGISFTGATCEKSYQKVSREAFWYDFGQKPYQAEDKGLSSGL